MIENSTAKKTELCISNLETQYTIFQIFGKVVYHVILLAFVALLRRLFTRTQWKKNCKFTQCTRIGCIFSDFVYIYVILHRHQLELNVINLVKDISENILDLKLVPGLKIGKTYIKHFFKLHQMHIR